MKTSATIALTFAALLSASLAASAQTEQPTVRRHHRVHQHHHYVAPSAVPGAVAQQPGAVESGPPQTGQMFRPYAHPGEGDDDGLSRDPDDCMKGCIGGNPE